MVYNRWPKWSDPNFTTEFYKFDADFHTSTIINTAEDNHSMSITTLTSFDFDSFR